ncbi:PIR Superfamily Protein [Plasmodium ovale wallikeri]|uniref:PIR Superfamily Protein n=1 Tax=Plasmodium ovale wallikeri TaxID=864142 RepID=A0A1A9AGG1_PLAOA|nr:PIR Superfamily Protein [Plasmodium ovale wallikeri]
MTMNPVIEHYENSQEYIYHNNILNDTDESTESITYEIINTYIPKEIDNRSIIISNCKKLYDYITRSNSNTLYDTNICFEIINYWLNSHVRLDTDEKNRTLFNTYKAFMEKYNKLNAYVSKIYYIDNKLYNKKKDLYELYKKYDNLLSILNPSVASQCALLSTIVNEYNNIIKQYIEKDNSNLPDVLTNFRRNFENKTSESITNCGSKILPFTTFVKKPISRVRETEHSQQRKEAVDRFPSQPSENIAPTLAITLFGTSLGSFLILMFFYKITLFGYRLRNKKNKNILMTNNLCEENYELPLYTSEAHDRNSEYSNYNVTYQSLEN